MLFVTSVFVTLLHLLDLGTMRSSSSYNPTTRIMLQYVFFLPVEIPVPTLDRVTEWLDVFPTETVKLRCQMQSNGWTFTWYKNTEEVKAYDIVKTGTSGSTLSIKSASASHRGHYTCSGEMKSRSVSSTHSSEVTLHIYGEIFCLLFTK